MAPQLLLSLLLLPLPQPTQENTPTLKSLFFSMKVLQGSVFLGLWVLCPRDRTRSSYSLGWMIPIPFSLLSSSRCFRGLFFFGSLADVSRGQNKGQLLSWMDDSHPPNSLLSSSGCLSSSLVQRQQITWYYLFNIRVSMHWYPCGMVLCI